MVSIRWLRGSKEATGTTDLLPLKWFAKVAPHGGTHRVVWDGGAADARCTLKASGTSVDRDYGSAPEVIEFNRRQGISLGTMRLIFQTPARRQISEVLWRATSEKDFEATNTAVTVPQASSRHIGWATTPDVAHNAAVESAAIACVVEHFRDLEKKDRQKDNCGWDLEFASNSGTLCVEVKGMSGSQIQVELTPNEFRAMESAMKGTCDNGDYKLAVVCDALGASRNLFLFAYEAEMDWLCELTGRRITASLRTAASFR
jgi:hypothetical protein